MNRSIAPIVTIAAIMLTAGAGTALYFSTPKTAQDTETAIAPEAVERLTTAAVPDMQPELPDADGPGYSAMRLKAALAELDTGNLGIARALARELEPGSVARDVFDWAVATSGSSEIDADFIGRVAAKHPDWPSQTTMKRNRERVLARGFFADQRLKAVVGDEMPNTIDAALVLAKSYRDAGDIENARKILIPFWHDDVLSEDVELSVPTEFADVLTKADHDRRYFHMMARERIRAASRIVEHTGYLGLHEAWAAVIRNQSDAGKLIADIPADLVGTEAALFMRIEYLRKKGLIEDAAELFAEVPTDTELSNPDAWWVERRIVTRSLREAGNLQAAYDIAAAQKGGDAGTQVEAAFHAGWYALRGLNDPQKATEHFARIETVAEGAASSARGAYWLGRAYAASGDRATATTQYERAARFASTYHGQLALVELGKPLQKLPTPLPADDTASKLETNRLYQAATLLREAGETRRSNSFFYALTDTLDTPGELAFITQKLAQEGDHTLALRLAKRAAWSGGDFGPLTHPTGAIPDLAEVPVQDMALAYAIARQESEFNIGAVSGADARGLLQLLPSTARAVAGRLDLPFESARLTTDAGYNATLGRKYLDEQLDRFDGSYILTFIGYNAGPGRARQWLERYGDPRGKPLYDVIDWIEQIPFTETRGYVQKVMENLQVYKAQLGGNPDIERDLRFGRQS